MKDVTETYINPVYAGREELRSMGASYLEVEPSGDMLSPHAEPGTSLCDHIRLCSMLYETPSTASLHDRAKSQALALLTLVPSPLATVTPSGTHNSATCAYQHVLWTLFLNARIHNLHTLAHAHAHVHIIS